MEKQVIRTFGRRHGKKLSARQNALIESVLPNICPSGKIENAVLEIGFGAGEHLRLLARENPDKIIVGAEPFVNGVASLMSAICDADNNILDEYKNIRVWADDVRDLFCQNDSLYKQIWVLHPDPWPKAKHEKRRLLNADFLTLLGKCLSPNGQIIIGTDHWEYFDWIVAQAARTVLNTTIADLDVIQTRYQNKNMAQTTTPKYLILENR
ncbi:MAG: hypothetical protein MJ187_02235 [Alphaproteobacteria bacterium]|nr:hypothetical protein [Alphaproteobacteria bacterium]